MFHRTNRRSKTISAEPPAEPPLTGVELAMFADHLTALAELANGHRLRLINMGFQPWIAEQVAAQMLMGLHRNIGSEATR